MRPSKKLTLGDLFVYGFPLPPKYDPLTQTWVITRFSNHKIYTQPICTAVGKRTYAPNTKRLIINVNYQGRNISITLARFLWCFFSEEHMVPEDHYVRLKDENKPYTMDNLELVDRKTLEEHKNKGNQYHSEKWHIIAKRYER